MVEQCCWKLFAADLSPEENGNRNAQDRKRAAESKKVNGEWFDLTDDDIKLFSLKNENDSMRFIESLSSYFLKNKRNDCLFVKDDSTPQRKYLLTLLSNSGYDKKVLYRKFTTFPRQEWNEIQFLIYLSKIECDVCQSL